MEEIVLEAELREGRGRANTKDLRESGYLPAVVYFHGQDALSVKISRSALLKLVHQYRLESVIINLKIKDGKSEDNGLASNSQSHKKAQSRPCLVKEIQYDPVREDIIHVDFNEISLTEAIKVNVPIQVKGEAIGVKQEGGSLEHLLWEIEVECLPTNIPKDIQVDITALKMGEAIHIKDIVFPSGVKPLNDLASIVLHVAAPMKEEAPAEAVEGEDAKEPEVIKEKKEIPSEAAQEVKEKTEKK
ncbi:MAG: 50S ribosomal protein L25 [Candidatus Omnitrophota bacterium]